MIADPRAQHLESTEARLADLGIATRSVQDGVEALLAVLSVRTRLTVLAVDLPRISGRDLCEFIKRYDPPQAPTVVLVDGSTGGKSDSLSQGEKYGPDLQVHPRDLPECLIPLLEPPVRSEAQLAAEPHRLQRQAASSSSDRRRSSVSSRSARAESTGEMDLEAERQKAERLARIVVSDILLYHPERFDRVVDEEKLIEEFTSEIQEGHTLLAQRVGGRCLAERDYLVDELLRVARLRTQD